MTELSVVDGLAIACESDSNLLSIGSKLLKSIELRYPYLMGSFECF